MNELAKQWVAALRSGGYGQTTGTLHDQEGYCCLGVACDISGLGKWVNDPEDAGNDTFMYAITDEYPEDSALPNEVRRALGLMDWAGRFIHAQPHGGLSLAKLNDAGKSFQEIADLIESEPAGLFNES